MVLASGSITGDRYVWPNVVETIGRASRGIRHTGRLRQELRQGSAVPDPMFGLWWLRSGI
jgi:hypothetical protein